MPLLRAALRRAPFNRFLSTDLSLASPKLRNLPPHLRRAAVPAARTALSDYLISTRSLPSSNVDSIVTLSPHSLLTFLAGLPALPKRFPPSSLTSHISRHLSFHPLNELPFFLESIGLPPSTESEVMFLTDHPSLLPAVAALVHFGFPWSRLGLLFPAVLLRVPPDIIADRLAALEARLHPLPRAAIIAACLSFPSLLENDLSKGELLLQDLGSAFGGLGPDLGASNDTDVFFAVCRRIQMFYDGGTKIGSIKGLMGCNQRVFFELKDEIIAKRLNFFKSLGMAREEVGSFLLSNPGICDVPFDDVVISVPGYLRRVGLAQNKIDSAVKEHPYVVGRNRLENLPGLLRAMGLNRWFLEKISGGGESLRYLSPDFVLEDDSYDMKVERAFLDGMVKLKADRNAQYLGNKLEFLKSIGYGENKLVTRVLPALAGTREMLQERFDYLLERGLDYQMLCRIVSKFPKVLNQCKEMLNDKLDYMTVDLGYSLEYLDSFPAILCFDLENRVKPRYAMLGWLRDHGLFNKSLAPATVLANSEKKFISILYTVHPAAPKLWLECFSSRVRMECYLNNLSGHHPVDE